MTKNKESDIKENFDEIVSISLNFYLVRFNLITNRKMRRILTIARPELVHIVTGKTYVTSSF